MATSTKPSSHAHSTKPLPSILMPELLGFSPQLLLDDIIEGANDTIFQCVEGLEPFLKRWAEKRSAISAQKTAKSESGDSEEWDAAQCVEQGLFAFQTLLESHTDIAFDFFEAWSLRNIFAIQPPDLPIVAPHHQGLDLNPRAGEEAELFAEIEELRRKIDNQKRLRRTYRRSLHISKIGLLRLTSRLSKLSYLTSENIKILLETPGKVEELFESVVGLPFIEYYEAVGVGETDGFGGGFGGYGYGYVGAEVGGRDDGEGRRMWEIGDFGYFRWALGEELGRAREMRRREGASSASASATATATASASASTTAPTNDGDAGAGAGAGAANGKKGNGSSGTAIGKLSDAARKIGTKEDLRRALEALNIVGVVDDHRNDNGNGNGNGGEERAEEDTSMDMDVDVDT